MKLDILALAAHPDDVEMSVGGTLAMHIAKGHKVGIVDFTRGELGTRGTPEIRATEAANAAAILGIHIRENLGFRDGFYCNDEAHQLKLVEVIRRYRPEIVLANAINERHIDHPKGAQLANDACFLSGLRMIKTYEADGTEQLFIVNAVSVGFFKNGVARAGYFSQFMVNRHGEDFIRWW